jgi:RHS repeat-associated protein
MTDIDSDGSADEFNPDVRTAQDYYAFGSPRYDRKAKLPPTQEVVVFRLRVHRYEAGDKIQILIPPVTQADPGAGWEFDPNLSTQDNLQGLVDASVFNSNYVVTYEGTDILVKTTIANLENLRYCDFPVRVVVHSGTPKVEILDAYQCPEAYRYAFNGKESDKEVYGEDNAYDFGARMYDARIGRWFTSDPLDYKYPNFSPYSFVANSPLLFVDKDGKDIYLYDKFRRLALVIVDGNEIQRYILPSLVLPSSFVPASFSVLAMTKLISRTIENNIDAVGVSFDGSFAIGGGLSTGLKAVFFTKGDFQKSAHIFAKAGFGLGYGGGASLSFFGASYTGGEPKRDISPQGWSGWFNSYNASSAIVGGSYFWGNLDGSSEFYPGSLEHNPTVWEGASISFGGANGTGFSATWNSSFYTHVATMKPVNDVDVNVSQDAPTVRGSSAKECFGLEEDE